MTVELIVLSGAKSTRLALKLPTVLGRSQEADIKVKHHHVSRRHCEIFADGNEIVLRDLDSANGTFVNRQRADAEIAMTSGDEIIIGAVVFRIEFGAAATTKESTVRENDQTTAGSGGEDVGFEPPEQRDSAARPNATLLSYGETDDGSFIDIHLDLEQPSPGLVSSGIELTAAQKRADDVSRIDLEVDGDANCQADDDSALQDFLRKRPE